MISSENAAILPGESWNNRRLLRLILPLILDQLLIVLLGIVDTVMVSSLGEAAVGGVSLVDAVNVVLINVFAALTTGGAVVCSQYLGRNDPFSASEAAKQLLYAVSVFALLFMLLILPAHSFFLRLIYGSVEPAIMKEAQTYLFFSALSYPFLALSAAGSALFRSMGDSGTGMLTSFVVNVLNVGGNSLFIFGFGWGVAGAALSTLISRAAAAVLLLSLLYRAKKTVFDIKGIGRIRFRPEIMRSILKVGIPNGIEGGIFQIGKLALARLVSTFGTAAIAGNAVASIIMTIGNLPGLAIAQALLTVVGQSMGAGNHEAARRHTKKLVIFNYIVMAACNLFFILIMPFFLSMFHLSPESTHIARICGTIFCGAAIFIWIPAYCLPFALRAAGDGPYTMAVSALAMWLIRVGVAYLLAWLTPLGVYCVWVSMVCEWSVRGIGYSIRWRSGKWREQKVL